MLATVARVEGRSPVNKPVDLGGNVTRLPLSGPPITAGGKARTEVERGRQRALFWLGITFEHLLPLLPGQAHSMVDAASYDFEKFGSMDRPSVNEEAAFRSILDLERQLARLGIGTLELMQMIDRPGDFPVRRPRNRSRAAKDGARSSRRRRQHREPSTKG
jgi:hypothetical protein